MVCIKLSSTSFNKYWFKKCCKSGPCETVNCEFIHSINQQLGRFLGSWHAREKKSCHLGFSDLHGVKYSDWKYYYASVCVRDQISRKMMANMPLLLLLQPSKGNEEHRRTGSAQVTFLSQTRVSAITKWDRGIFIYCP